MFASRAMAVRHRAVVNEMYMAQAVQDSGTLGRVASSRAEDVALVEGLRQRNGQLEEEMAALRLQMRNNERNKQMHSLGLIPPPPPGAPLDACESHTSGGSGVGRSTTRYQMPVVKAQGHPSVPCSVQSDGQSSVEELRRTVESLQQQLAQKNIQIAQLQHATRKAQAQAQAAAVQQQVPPPQPPPPSSMQSPGEKNRQLLTRIAKQLSLISPLRDHFKKELAEDM